MNCFFFRLLLLVLLATCKDRNYALDVSLPSPKNSSKSAMNRGTGNDIVSKNITMVLENLLMNYENNQLPTHGEGKAEEKVTFPFCSCCADNYK